MIARLTVTPNHSWDDNYSLIHSLICSGSFYYVMVPTIPAAARFDQVNAIRWPYFERVSLGVST